MSDFQEKGVHRLLNCLSKGRDSLENQDVTPKKFEHPIFVNSYKALSLFSKLFLKNKIQKFFFMCLL